MADMSSEDCRASTTSSSGNIDETGNTSGRRMSHFKEYKFFRSFSAKVENWPMRKAEALWRRMRERKIAASLVQALPRRLKFNGEQSFNPTDAQTNRLRNLQIQRKAHTVVRWYNVRVEIYLWRPVGLIIDHNINVFARWKSACLS
ncbi:uncharacterized protein LOC112638235 [Camponotus floridanus]|nr:uncharacterized protein LOC112638235 [Camponotus floridanus]